MAINYTDWNNGIKNGTFYPLGYNDLPMYGTGDTRWLYKKINNNIAYKNTSTSDYCLLDTASLKGWENDNFTITVTESATDYSFYFPNMKGELFFDVNDKIANNLKIKAPQLNSLAMGNSGGNWLTLDGALDIDLKNAWTFTLNEGSSNLLKISGTNLKNIIFTGGNVETIEINCPNLETFNIHGGTFGDMSMNTNPNCIINMTWGTFTGRAFKGAYITHENCSLSGGILCGFGGDFSKFTEEGEMIWIFMWVQMTIYALEDILEQLIATCPLKNETICYACLCEGEDPNELVSLKARYAAAGYTLIDQEEYFNMDI